MEMVMDNSYNNQHLPHKLNIWESECSNQYLTHKYNSANSTKHYSEAE